MNIRREMKAVFLSGLSFFAATILRSTIESEEEAVTRERRFAPVLEQAIVTSLRVQLLSIAPDSRYQPARQGRNYVLVDEMEGRRLITREVVISDREAIAALAASLRRSIEEDREFGPPPCFSPRHAIRFTRDSEEVTVLVCFECSQCYTHRFEGRSYFQVSRKPEPIWTAIFTKAGLKNAEE